MNMKETLFCSFRKWHENQTPDQTRPDHRIILKTTFNPTSSDILTPHKNLILSTISLYSIIHPYSPVHAMHSNTTWFLWYYIVLVYLTWYQGPPTPTTPTLLTYNYPILSASHHNNTHIRIAFAIVLYSIALYKSYVVHVIIQPFLIPFYYNNRNLFFGLWHVMFSTWNPKPCMNISILVSVNTSCIYNLILFLFSASFMMSCNVHIRKLCIKWH